MTAARRFLFGFICVTILLSLLPMAPTTALAQEPLTRYVSTGGIDCFAWEGRICIDWNHCLDENQPCRTITHASGQALPGDTILVFSGVYTEREYVNQSVTVMGTGPTAVILDGQGSHLVLAIIGPVAVSVSGVTIQNGLNTSGEPGGCIYVGYYASLTLSDSVVRGCAAGFGGGVANRFRLTLDNSTITDNWATYDGGGIFNSGALVLNGSTVAANAAGRHGGGIFDQAGLTLAHSTVEGNTAGADGGGIYNEGRLTATDSAVRDNSAGGDGGGMWISGAWSTDKMIAGTDVSANAAGGQGGGIFKRGSRVTLSGSSIRNNTAYHGGGMANVVGSLFVTTSTISGNTASGQGGGIVNVYDGGEAATTLVDSTVSDNVASTGGGVSNVGPGHVWVTNSTLSGNEALVSGGGAANNFGAVIATNATVSGNTAASQGGGVWSTLTGRGGSSFSNSILAGNTLGGSEGEGRDCWGPLWSQGYNLIENVSDCAIHGDTTGNILGLGPLLGPLQANGGPTFTHALLPGSPAIDAGNPSGCTDHLGNPLATDQRGVPRPQGPACDIGAFELEVSLADADADGIPDSLEIATGTDPGDADTDDDGLCDGFNPPDCASEDLNNNGVVDPGETDPRNWDTDGDGLSDGLEVGLDTPQTTDTNTSSPHWQPDADPSTTTNPLNPDGDGDGVPDGVEDENQNGRLDPGEGDPTVRDVAAPASVLFLHPSIPNGENGWYVSPLTVAISAEDNIGGTGVASTEYRLNGGAWQPYAGPFTLSSDGTTTVEARSTDNAGNVEDPPVSATVHIDQSAPTVAIEVPAADEAVQDGITLAASAGDPTSGVADVRLYVREDTGGSGTPVGFEDVPTTYNPGSGNWEYYFDSTQLPDGYYIILAKAEDNAGNEGWSELRQFSIRNWAVLELLPASESNKAGRTMPVKFSLSIAAAVDPAQPFVRNEELTIKIYETGHPVDVLQESTYGDTARDYRIDSVGELYITNFKTLNDPKDYTVEISRKDFLVGSFTFSTVK